MLVEGADTTRGTTIELEPGVECASFIATKFEVEAEGALKESY